jgi:hypothetical protein
MSKIKNEDITFLYTYYDTPVELFENSLKSVINRGIKILIVDDMSSEEGVKNLNKVVKSLDKDNLVSIVRPHKKMQQEGCTYYGASLIKTKYTIRIDSDDKLISLPHYNSYIDENNKEYDLILSLKNKARNIEDLYKGKNSNINGSIIKTELVMFMYSDYEFMIKFHNFFHEDLYAGYKLFLFKEINSYQSNIKSYKYVMKKDSNHHESKKKPFIAKRCKRAETLMAVATQNNLSFEEYEYGINMIKEYIKD